MTTYPSSSEPETYIDIFIPMVILSGEIYFMDATAKRINPQKMNHVTLARSLKSKTIRGNFLIEFIRAKDLKHFFNTTMKPIIKQIKKIII